MESKFEIGTVYTNTAKFHDSESVAGWMCIDRKVSVRKNARIPATSKIITARFVRVDKNGKQLGDAKSLRVFEHAFCEEVTFGGKVYPLLRIKSVNVVANAAA